MKITLFGWRLTNERHAAVPMCGNAEQQYRFDGYLMRRECLLVQGHGPGHVWGLWRKT